MGAADGAVVTGPLAAARAAKASGDPRGELSALLEAWRQRPALALAELIEAASARAPAEPLPGAKTAKDALVAWVERARRGDPLDLPVLLAALEQAWADFRPVALVPRLEELKARTPDPRMTEPLLRLLRRLSLGNAGHASVKVWGRLVTLLVQCGDPRVEPALAEYLAWLDALPVRRTYAGSHVAHRVKEARERLLARQPGGSEGAPMLGPEEEILVAALRTTAAGAVVAAPLERVSASEQDLLAAIHAAPEDDAPRLVYADWLVEREDPRGELINLQIALARGEGTPRAERRANALVKQLGKALLGPLARCVAVKDAVFERGFLAAATVRVRTKGLAETELSDPAWATVRRLTFDGPSLVTPAMRALEVAQGLSGPALNKLCASGHPRLAALAAILGDARLEGGVLVSAALRSLGKTTRLPALRRLGLWHPTHDWREPQLIGPSHLAWLWTTPVGQRLERVELTADLSEPAALEAWSAWLERAPPALRELALGSSQSAELGPRADQVVFRRGEGGAFTEVVLGPYEAPARTIHEQVVASLPPERALRLTLLPSTRRWEGREAALAKLREQVASRLRHAEVLAWDAEPAEG